MKKRSFIYISLIAIMTIAIGVSCSGGGSETPPTTPDPTGQQEGNPNLASVSGRVVDLERQPIGGSNVSVQLFDERMAPLSAVFHPQASGPLQGQFSFVNLPLNTTIILVAEHTNPIAGRLIGFEQEIRFTRAEALDLGDCVLSNEHLALGWSAYKVKKYNLAIYHFKRALNTRHADALTQSSSAYTGLGWAHAKRGQDRSGAGPANRGFEWQEAINYFNNATVYQEDADAYVGMAGAYMTLIGNTILLNPDMYNFRMYIYGFMNLYQEDALEALEKALAAAPDYDSSHDRITADDLRACVLYNRYLIGETITQDEIDDLIVSKKLNIGSLQLLTSMSELIAFDAHPKM